MNLSEYVCVCVYKHTLAGPGADTLATSFMGSLYTTMPPSGMSSTSLSNQESLPDPDGGSTTWLLGCRLADCSKQILRMAIYLLTILPFLFVSIS